MMNSISAAGNTVVPALLALEALGFTVSVERLADCHLFRANRNEESYIGEDPVVILGLVKLVELRQWTWRATDVEIERVIRHYMLE